MRMPGAVAVLAVAILVTGCARADITAREGSLWGFMLVLFLASMAAPFVFSLVVVPLFGLLALTLRRSTASFTIVSYPVFGLLFAAQAYFWGLWGGYCSWLAAGYAASPYAWPAWVYYVLGFGVCTAPIGFLSSTEQAVAKTAQEARGIQSGTSLYGAVAALAYIVFSVWPAAAHPLYGWFLVGDQQPSRVADTSPGGQPRSFKCTQPLPEFTLGATSNPSNEDVERLCACIWSKFPERGWEREVSAKIRNGEDPGWRGRGFGPRFGAAMKARGGLDL